MVLQQIHCGGKTISSPPLLLATIGGDQVSAGLLIATAFVGLLALAEWLRARFGVQVEWTRKIVHMGGGFACLAIPFAIDSHWIVLILAASMGAILLVSRQLGMLQSVHAIKRKSRGSEYYPIVVYLLFLLTQGKPWLFAICILVLAVSDTSAALVGKNIGRIRFAIEDEHKSLEGSLAFLASTFVFVIIPLAIWNPLANMGLTPSQLASHYVLATLLICLLVTCFELVSLEGKDNLFIPLGTFLVLTKTLQTDVADLIYQNVSFIGILSALIIASLVTRQLNIGGAISLCLACYGCWAMGSFAWAFPLFVGFGGYLALCYVWGVPWKLRVRPIGLGVLTPMLILAVGNLALNNDSPEVTRFCFGPFLAAVVVGLSQALSNVTIWSYGKPFQTRKRTIAGVIGICVFAACVLPLAISFGFYEANFYLFFLGTTIPILILSASFLPALPPGLAPTRWLYCRVGFAGLAAVLVALWQWLDWCPIWPPV